MPVDIPLPEEQFRRLVESDEVGDSFVSWLADGQGDRQS